MRRLFVFSLAIACLVAPATAWAQYRVRPLSDRATGETYHVELAGSFWFPDPTIVISSEGSGPLSGVLGTDIDAVKDLGFERKRFNQLRVVLRPATKQKFRLDFTTIKYDAATTLQTQIVFNGIRFPVGIPIDSSLEWKAFRFAYEYDFVYRSRGFVGLILEAKYTDVKVNLQSLFIGTEFARARAPIPTVGGIGRFYVVPNISVTFDMTGFKLPNFDEKYKANYLEWDLYGTVNFTDNVGAQLGYRSLDVKYTIEADHGDFLLKGPYFGGVVRF